MKGIYVANVGDGLCMSIDTIFGKGIQIDCGGQNTKKAYAGFKMICNHFKSPDVFVLSHFHIDHYNGLLRASNNPHHLPSIMIKQVYYPRIPEFKERKEFLQCLFAMNCRVFGNETGSMEYDFLNAIFRINGMQSFEYKPISKGDEINIEGSIFEVLWPPRVIDNKKTLTPIRRAINIFNDAMQIDRELERLYGIISEEGVFEDVLNSKGGTKKYIEIKNPIQKNENKELPEITKIANKYLREAANHMSLAMFEDNRFVFFGDAEKFEIECIAKDLMTKGRKKFNTLITPHHGSHWSKSLKQITCINAISSNGSNLYPKMKRGFNRISNNHFNTYSDKDIKIP